MYRTSALVTLLLLSPAEDSRAYELDPDLCRTACRLVEDLGFHAMPAYAAEKGTPGQLKIEDVRSPQAHEVARIDGEGAVVFGPFGWCRDCGLPVPAQCVVINVGDAGTPLRIGDLELPRGGYAAIEPSRVVRTTPHELCAAAGRKLPLEGKDMRVERSESAVPEETITPTMLGEELSAATLAPELEAWRRPRFELVGIRVARPARSRVNLDSFSLWQGGRVIARCCGIAVLSEEVSKATGATQMAFTSEPVPRLWLRCESAMFERVVHEDRSGTRPKLPPGPQLLVGDDLVVAERGKDEQIISSPLGFELLGAFGCRTTLGCAPDGEAPTLCGRRAQALTLLFQMRPGICEGIELRYAGGTRRNVAAASFPNLVQEESEIAQVEPAPPVERTAPEATPKPPSKWPKFRGALPRGRHELQIANHRNAPLKLGLRDERGRGRGRDLRISAGGSATVALDGGDYEVFATWADEEGAVYQGDSFSLATNPMVIQQVSLTFGADSHNYDLRRL